MLPALLIAATVQGPFDIESLTASADAVVYGRVIRRTSAWTKGGGQIFTAVVLHSIEAWKGTPAGEMTVLVPGGEVGDLSQTVQGAAAVRLSCALPGRACVRTKTNGTGLCVWSQSRAHGFQIDSQGTPDAPTADTFAAIRSSLATWAAVSCTDLAFPEESLSTSAQNR